MDDTSIDTSAKFYKEILECDMQSAQKIASFMKKMYCCPAVKKLSPWGKNGITRVYLEIKSQNSLSPITDMQDMYYCANEHDILVYVPYIGKKSLSFFLKKNIRGMFSGAKTRQSLHKMGELFYG